MNAKAQYKEAYRIARTLKGFALEVQYRMITELKWNFQSGMYSIAKMALEGASK